jgi:hypothetical protein
MERKQKYEDELFIANSLSEVANGASNCAGVLSNGRMAVGVSPWAELAFLRWPHLSHSDQLRYSTRSKLNSWSSILGYLSTSDRVKLNQARMTDDAPSTEYHKMGRAYETLPGLGSRGGVWVPGPGMIWSEDPGWLTDRTYLPEDGPLFQTSLTDPSRNLSMNVVDWVDPELDLLVRDFSIACDAGNFIYHATFAPWNGRHDHFIPATFDPKDAGYAAVYCQEEDIILHFNPGRKRKLPNRPFWSPDLLDQLFPEPGGVYVAWGFINGATENQVGPDQCTKIRTLKRNNHQIGGRCDAQDGRLSGYVQWQGTVDCALLTPLPTGGGKVTVLIAVGKTASQAFRIIQSARKSGPENLRLTALQNGQKIADRIIMPPKTDPVARRVAKRSILTVLASQDKASGAIVASLSRQPPYHFDWGRDGSFFDLALDLAGFPELVNKHHEFYRQHQYKKGWSWNIRSLLKCGHIPLSLKGHWPANLAADGDPGFWPTPFEIDETALTIWNIWRHERYLPSKKRLAYRKRMKKTLELGADALLNYVDQKRGWVLPAFEDDNLLPSATLHGASAVLTGLSAAVSAGPLWDISKSKILQWQKAALGLSEGIHKRLTQKEFADTIGWRGLHWSLFPAPLFTGDEITLKTLRDRLASEIKEKINSDRQGFSYLGEQIFTLAASPGDQSTYKPLILEGMRFLLETVPFPGSDHFGEVTWKVDTENGPFYQNRTAIPHGWNSILIYLALWAIRQPQTIHELRPPKT